jgi:type VI secretion system secreted protein VgrG
VHGPQTAKVVGKQGEEIDVDEFGRITVQFHWDRDKKPSRRVRVAQVWSGKTWGGQIIPRIGQEVVVEFLEGDPDRPLVVGTVYNNDYKHPYGLPANKTQSGLKTESTKGGGGYNELMYEDKERARSSSASGPSGT